MSGHTKTPWRVEEGTDLIWGDCNPDDQTTYGMGYSIVSGHTAHHQRGKPSIDEREANAAFIVRACNMHDRLIRALEELHATVVGESPSLLNENSGGNARLAIEIEELLALAKGDA